MSPAPQGGLRSVAEQSQDEQGGPRSILARQQADHVDFHRFRRAFDAESDPDARGRIMAELAERALRHAFAEETVLFPAYRRSFPGPDGDELTAHIEGDHQEINDLLTQLQDADPRSPRYEGLARRVFAAIDDDARHEEDVLLPRLQQRVSADELRAIGDAWEASREASPTRPHPKISRRPPWNALAALGLSVSDRVKDVVDDVAPRGTARRAAGRWALAGTAGLAAATALGAGARAFSRR
ncbi:hemerythrin domain-containing protein [Quadrisphaera sp. DSM 44207]|uniref:hemerythrin domain-containing protein n=1 Tax=Quadrisphaera sp. DSM 44207 TaxID=1881057 RepID=UPI00088645AA|nr:hemerythrin domain-containing protein [Quadrisphaera sp. DSM 44207]SDQ47282.1 Hemerythrin HHE cation binding domain-containing protein [Quadrisphaera sp. DSM 44207]